MLLRIICIAALLLPPSASAKVTHHYTVRIDDGLERMFVDARFSAPVTRIQARDRQAGRYLERATDCTSGEAIGHRGRRLDLPPQGISCLRYSIDLARLARDDRRNASLASANVVVSPAAWLWRPRIDGDTVIKLRFDTPHSVSVPWAPLEAGVFRLDASPGSGRSVSAFGRFERVDRQVGDSVLRIAMLTPDGGFDYEAIEEWLVSTAKHVLLSYGRFPNPSPQVLVVPTGRGASPVPFGRVLRDGGEAVELFINERRPIEAFYDDWTATHEFSHLMLPYVTIRQRWVSEGFAQYYQNVLLARAGIYDAERAWQKLYEGLERGRRSGFGLSPNAASLRGMREALMKIYWSGASIALMADVEIRRRSGGEETLDHVLGRLQSCCLPSERVWTAMELFEALDAQLDEPVFVPLYKRYADAPGFPDYRPVFNTLGIGIEAGRVVLTDDARLAELRDAIVRPSSFSASSEAREPARPRTASSRAAP